MRNRNIFVACLLCCALPCLGAQDKKKESILDRTGEQVNAYLDQLSDVKCTESVVQEKLAENGHKEREQRTTYDYLILLQGNHDDLLLSESRLPTKDSAAPKDAMPMLLTNGFSNLFLIFHPYYRDSFRFEEQGSGVIGGRKLVRIAFSHIAGTRTPAALAVRGREYPLELTGTAWIDEESATVARMEAGLGNDMHDVGLRALKIDVQYEPMVLPGWEHNYSFPVSARVDVETMKQHWRNVHQFSDYKRFTVDSESTVIAQKENQ